MTQIRCIQIGGPSGPVIQGPAEIETVRIFSTGEHEPTGYATITVAGQTFKGKMILSIRRIKVREVK